MIKYAIIEDNPFAMEHLRLAVSHLRHEYELVFTATSVEETTRYLQSSPDIQLIFMDIELSDGKCFTIFERVATVVPIIFTTAYDDFAIQAFKVNGVDYLLKPIEENALAHAIDKFEHLRLTGNVSPAPMMEEPTSNAGNKVKRILTVSGDKYSYIKLSDVSFFMSEDNYVFVYLKEADRRMINLNNLSELEKILPGEDFFRISRNVIASIDCIKVVSKYFRGRLLVKLESYKESPEISVSASKRDQFLEWLGR
jgi:DNA-binding LytR/AlgR family response regulator